MPTDDRSKANVIVFGDRTSDEYLLHLKRRGGYGHKSGAEWQNHDQWIRLAERGGVFMTTTMLSWYFHPNGLYLGEITTQDNPLVSLARLERCIYEDRTGRPTAFDALQVSRTNSLGNERFRIESYDGYHGKPPTKPFSYKMEKEPPPAPAAIVINDAGTELRHSQDDKDNAFCQSMQGLRDNATHVLLKMHFPLAQGLAWEEFVKAGGAARSRIVIVHADDLRSDKTHISRCPSWDQVVEDLLVAISDDAQPLRKLVEGSDALLVLFDVEGVALIEGQPGKAEITLICDPMRAEREISQILPGDMIGKMNCFLAAFLNCLLLKDTRNAKAARETAARQALVASRLYAESYFQLNKGKNGKWRLKYPKMPELIQQDEKRQETANPGNTLPTYLVAKTSQPNTQVQLLSTAINPRSNTSVDEYKELAEKIVREGVEESLASLPHGRFGKLWTVDREEIEGLRAIAALIRSYLADTSQSKPLSIAVFGPPGSGKSFGVKQLVDEHLTPILEFNLSQADQEQLPGFFHDIRDSNLKGKTPLCFFDEFDSQNLDLLKYFLAPMQDGIFREGAALRPVGRGILVFAGGTCESLAEFKFGTEGAPDPKTFGKSAASSASLKELNKEFSEARKIGREKKKPDFISRLHGSFDVKGPNPIARFAPARAKPLTHAELVKGDPAHFIRRAILLRRFIEGHLGGIISKEDNLASIEPALLTALVGVEKYRHGARSMELLIRSMALGTDTVSIGRSDLPIDGQIGMHVTIDSFKGS